MTTRLGRSNKAVRLKARELGVKPPPAWTAGQLARLRAEYPHVEALRLAGRAYRHFHGAERKIRG